MKKVIFIGSIATKKTHFDGERNKSLSICNCLSSLVKLKRINLSSHALQVFAMIRFSFLVIFWRPSYVFIGKSPRGCYLILRLLRILHYQSKKIICYPYGRGLYRYKDKIDCSFFKYAGTIICENHQLIPDWSECGCDHILVFPCVRKWFDINQPSVFQHKETLKCIFWARVDKEKGVFTAIEAVIEANKKMGKQTFSLSIAGKPSDKLTEDKIIEISKQFKEIKYLGTTFTAGGRASFEELSTFDLNIFPTAFFHECVPGSVIDNLMAGVPTISTRFFGYYDMLNNSNAYFLNNQDPHELADALMQIFDDQLKLFEKRDVCKKDSLKYSETVFIDFLIDNFDLL
jgi:glycosyltransferase involved in cell wall biosynthesis